MRSTPWRQRSSRTPGSVNRATAIDAPARRGALRQPRERRPHLAADAEHDDVAGDAREIRDERRRGRRHHVLEVLDALESVGQGHGRPRGSARGSPRGGLRAHLRGTPCRQACRCSPTLTIFIVLVPPDLPIGSPNEITIRSPASTTPFFDQHALGLLEQRLAVVAVVGDR